MPASMIGSLGDMLVPSRRSAIMERSSTVPPDLDVLHSLQFATNFEAEQRVGWSKISVDGKSVQ